MIAPEIQAELRQRFNPDGSDLRKMQLRMLEMLKYIDRICRENDIQYWLSSGTCLGAVRHGGFIPWDDDVDVEMLDADYKKLVTVLMKQKSDCFGLQTHSTDKNFIFDFGKLRDLNDDVQEVNALFSTYKFKGISIDLFRLDNSNSKKIHYICGRMRVVEHHIRRIFLRHKIISFLLGTSIRAVNNLVIGMLKPLDKLHSGNRLRHVLGVTFTKPRFKNDIFPLQRLKFEDYDFPVPGDYDSYLKKLFGDYMVMKQEHIHIKS